MNRHLFNVNSFFVIQRIATAGHPPQSGAVVAMQTQVCIDKITKT